MFCILKRKLINRQIVSPAEEWTVRHAAYQALSAAIGTPAGTPLAGRAAAPGASWGRRSGAVRGDRQPRGADAALTRAPRRVRV